MILFGGKPLDKITKSDLEQLVLDKYHEGDSLDFKAILKFESPDDIVAFLKDIVSFANHRGGYIIVGIGESKEAKDQAGAVVAVPDCEKLARRCRDLYNAHIEPRIFGLEIQSVPFESADGAVVIKIPRSFHAPHMIRFNDLNQFWVRRGRENRLMSVEEIKYACRVTQNIFQDIKEFLAERRVEFQHELPQEAIIRITATPLLVEEDVIDIHDNQIRELLLNPPGFVQNRWMTRCRRVQPALYGLKGDDPQYNNYDGAFDLFRNGHLECVRHLDLLGDENSSGHLVILPIAITAHVVSFTRLAWHLFNYLQIATPMVASMEFYNLTGIGLPSETESIRRRFDNRVIRHFEVKQKTIVVPARQVYLTQDPELVARDLCDVLWNSVGFDRAPHFDPEGKWTGGGKE